MPLIFHLDLDSFFVSVEQILDPTLVGKPVIVGGDSDGRGVVAACSYEARTYGVRSGMPAREAVRLCPKALFIRGHHEEYSRYSKLVRASLKRYAPIMEQASVDEFYMDFTGCYRIYGAPVEIASMLQKTIYRELKLPSSIGIGTNKTIAKICSDFHKPRGITYVIPGMEQEFLAPLPVEVIPGVGKVFQAELYSKGIKFVRDVLKVSPEYLGAAFGKMGTYLWHKAMGEGETLFITDREQKSISRESTFFQDIGSPEEMRSILFNLTAEVAQQLREQKKIAATVTLKLRYSDFITVTRSKTSVPTHDDAEIFSTVCMLLEKAYTRRCAVRLLGVGLSNFAHEAVQDTLFPNEGLKREKMLKTVSTIRYRYGEQAIAIGAYSGEKGKKIGYQPGGQVSFLPPKR